MRIKIAVIVAAALTLSGCVETIAEDRVRTALLDAGVPPGDAGCMSERMVDRLSIDQLKRLEALKARTAKPNARVPSVSLSNGSVVSAMTRWWR